jgi:hypothetical protein
MAAINSTQQLAKIRSQIDVQQQIIGQLEMDLQNAILGAPRVGSDRSLQDIVQDIQGLYGSVTGGGFLGASFKKGVDSYVQDKNGNLPDLSKFVPEQDVIRHMLYQARALLGDLRVSEQQWNQEVSEEKARKKELTEFAKA